MTFFLLGCIFLLTLAVFFSIGAAAPIGRRKDSRTVNLGWYKIRQLEISSEDLNAEDLSFDARIRTTSDIASIHEHELERSAFPRRILALFVMATALIIYFFLGSVEDVILKRRIQGIEHGLDDSQLSSLILSIEDRIVDRPNNPDYLNLSAQYRLANGEFDLALEQLRKLAELTPRNARVLAAAAKASFFANGRRLDQEGRFYAERSLEIDPQQAVSLGVLGFSAFGEQEYSDAINYFNRLLSLQNSSPEDRAILESYIDSARQLTSNTGNQIKLQPETPASLLVKVSLPQQANLSGAEVLFLSVRDVNAKNKIPILAIKRSARELPLSIVLNDSYSMIGKSLSDYDVVEVVAHVSPTGRAGDAFATWSGSSGPVSVSDNEREIAIKLERKDF